MTVCTLDHTVVYHLDCQDCDFETRVEEGHETLLDVIEAHQEEYDATHFVEFELVDDAEA